MRSRSVSPLPPSSGFRSGSSSTHSVWWTNQTQEARVYSHDGANQTQEARVYSHDGANQTQETR
eukprot:448265-Prorocentrum_minimum.AAC.1